MLASVVSQRRSVLADFDRKYGLNIILVLLLHINHGFEERVHHNYWKGKYSTQSWTRREVSSERDGPLYNTRR